MEKQGSAFGIHGIGGMLVATVLLLAILAGLTTAALVTQQATAQQSYEIKDPLSIKMRGDNLSNEEKLVIHGTPVGGDSLHKYKFEN
ncbi:DUF4006 family protein [Hydrogenimonas thermophila]|uniref:DUF4006 domain-containing protein n=1 Tax=Hydrogenimonas thermophila TaxID=223786 RepID=A0A1I5L7G1_9BACT|nr:DUF4006 family protein [Hydrogenimonas thermophila]WOE70087.1 DUF4006 family protein [Hydrogenimonas thermophila]WOE72604.1 DUF4006 family protein [Hydrogenimonas thermophila]SFO93197.1 Family of unknown function [Hydrogenimonas thermophila]